MNQIKKLLGLILFFFLISCATPEDRDEPSKYYQANFWVSIQGHPGTYQDAAGVWHIKHAGLNYFTVRGELKTNDTSIEINNVPDVETSFDSNFFFLPGNIVWTYPVYSYLGLWNSGQMNTPIPIGTRTYTFRELSGQSTIMNLAGYTIEPHIDWYANKSVLQTYFSTSSRYTYKPQQSMVFFRDFIGKTADIYIKVSFGYGKPPVQTTLKVIFEN